MAITNIQVNGKTSDEKRNDTLRQKNSENIKSAYSSEETFDNTYTPKNTTVSTKPRSSYNEKNGYSYNNGIFSKSTIDPKLNYVNVKRSGDTAMDNTLENAGRLYNIKKEYETKSKADPNFNSSDYAKNLTSEADRIRKTANLPDDFYGAGVTADDVMAKINYILDSPQYQQSKSNTDFKKLLSEYTQNIFTELTNEEKTRAVLSYLEAKEQAENTLKPQIEQAVKDTVESQNNASVRRGMYGQVPASILSSKALADVALKGQTAINDYAMNLISQDKEDALREYEIAMQNKQNKVNGWEKLIESLKIGYDVDQNYLANKQAREDAEKLATAEALQQEFKNALEIDANNRAWGEFGLKQDNLALDKDKFNWQQITDSHDMELANKKFDFDVYESERDFGQRQAEHNDDMNLGYYKANISASKGSSKSSKTTKPNKYDSAESKFYVTYYDKNGNVINPNTATAKQLQNATAVPKMYISNSSIIKSNGEVQHWFTQDQLEKETANGNLKVGYNSSGQKVYYFKNTL